MAKKSILLRKFILFSDRNIVNHLLKFYESPTIFSATEFYTFYLFSVGEFSGNASVQSWSSFGQLSPAQTNLVYIPNKIWVVILR